MDENVDLSAVAQVPVLTAGALYDDESAAYTFERAGRVFYVGQTGDRIRSRLSEHRRAGLAFGADRVAVYDVATPVAARRLEANLIAFYRPEANEAKARLTPTERAWYESIRLALSHHLNRQTWSWCRQCGELLMVCSGVPLHATHHEGPSCSPPCYDPDYPTTWEPSGVCWSPYRHAVAALVGTDFCPCGCGAK